MAESTPVVMYSPTGSKVMVESHLKDSLMKAGWRMGSPKIGDSGTSAAQAARGEQTEEAS